MSMPTILQQIVDQTRARLGADPIDLHDLEVAARSAPPVPDALPALGAQEIAIIAEVKRQSPSAGRISDAPDPVAIARAYAAGGAAAISVLTEPDHFGGSLCDLRSVASQVSTPCLRKDFIVGRRQIFEARAAGASLVLLIAAVLDDGELVSLRELAEGLGMHALVEAHTAEEAQRSAGSGARIIGINNRDLHTFDIDLATSETLRALIPDTAIAISESGVRTRADIDRLMAAGYGAFLVGTSLMSNNDPEAGVRALLTPAP